MIISWLLLSSALPTDGHGYIVETTPADGAELANAPTELIVIFNEALVPNTGAISLIDGSGNAISLGDIQHVDDVTLQTDITQDLSNGAYIMNASATVVSDGHEPSASIVFWIGERTSSAIAPPENDTQLPYDLLGVLAGAWVVLAGIGGGLVWRDRNMVASPPSESIERFELE